MRATWVKVAHCVGAFDFGKEVVPNEVFFVRVVHLMGNVARNGDKYGKLGKFVITKMIFT